MNGTSRFCWRGLTSCSFISLLAAIGISSAVQAQTVGPLVQVTIGDPFGACTADNVHRQQIVFGSTLYPNTDIEPWVAVDPTDPSRLLVGTPTGPLGRRRCARAHRRCLKGWGEHLDQLDSTGRDKMHGRRFCSRLRSLDRIRQ